LGQPVVHFEIVGSDGAKLRSFYGDLFDWEIDANNPWDYGIVSANGQGGIGGGVGTSPNGSRVTVYVQVPDPQAALDRAEQLGGKTVMPVTEIPGAVTMALFADPDGNVVGVVKG
jgi:predicted enzyme related to lactoylglutathione lyase